MVLFSSKADVTAYTQLQFANAERIAPRSKGSRVKHVVTVV